MAAFCLLLGAVEGPSTDVKSEKPRGEVRTVVLDPGHGGRDPGAVGPGGVFEKDVVLEVCRRIKEKLEKRGFRVVLTRDKDVFVKLRERAQIANCAKADIFISVHANASRRGGWGFETYFLSATASDDEARKVALLENHAAMLEDVQNGGLSPEINSDIEAILLDMAQAEYVRESEKLAVIIQDHLDDILKSPNRGVKQAPFMVLMGAAMPAVLVEIGFVSSRKEVKLLKSPEMQNRIAESLSGSVCKFAAQRAIRLGLGEGPKNIAAEGS